MQNEIGDMVVFAEEASSGEVLCHSPVVSGVRISGLAAGHESAPCSDEPQPEHSCRCFPVVSVHWIQSLPVQTDDHSSTVEDPAIGGSRAGDLAPTPHLRHST